MHSEPVKDAAPPVASTIPSCRWARPSSAPVREATASLAVAPPLSRARPSAPYSGFAWAWVATAPTPARADGTTAPTAGNLEATATPQSPRSGSQATIENVMCSSLERTPAAPLRPSGRGDEGRSIVGHVFEEPTRAQDDRLERSFGQVHRHLALARQAHVQPT